MDGGVEGLPAADAIHVDTGRVELAASGVPLGGAPRWAGAVGLDGATVPGKSLDQRLGAGPAGAGAGVVGRALARAERRPRSPWAGADAQAMPPGPTATR